MSKCQMLVVSQMELRKAEYIMRQMRMIKGVNQVCRMYGRYQLFAMLEADNYSELGKIYVDEFQPLLDLYWERQSYPIYGNPPTVNLPSKGVNSLLLLKVDEGMSLVLVKYLKQQEGVIQAEATAGDYSVYCFFNRRNLNESDKFVQQILKQWNCIYDHLPVTILS